MIFSIILIVQYVFKGICEFLITKLMQQYYVPHSRRFSLCLNKAFALRGQKGNNNPPPPHPNTQFVVPWVKVGEPMIRFKEGKGMQLEPYWHFGRYLFFQGERALKNCQQLLSRLQQTQRTLPQHPPWLVSQFKFCEPGSQCGKLYYYLNLNRRILPAIPLAY